MIATEKNGRTHGQLSKATKAKAKSTRGVSMETPSEHLAASTDKLDWPADYKADIAQQLEVEGFETVQRVVSIPLFKLHRHAKNRVITPESVADLTESLQEHGQRDPIRVRPLKDPIGHFEILSGERRYVAASQANPPMESLLAIVETHSDSQSLIELAVANAARQDLNPIERSELLAQLVRSIDDGGAGMERSAAGRLFGLNTDSAVKNAIRLLKLPPLLRDKVASGELAVRKVRPLCAYPDAILTRFCDWLKKADCWMAKEYFNRDVDDEEQEEAILHFLRRETRPVDQVVPHDHGYQLGGELNCLFKLDDLTQDKRAELQVVEIPHVLPTWERRRDKATKGKIEVPATRLVALNTKLWHKIQDPLVKVAIEAKKSGSKTKASKSSPKKEAATLTPAELKAQAKAKRKKADESLAHFTREWICLALRYQCSLISSWSRDQNDVLNLIPWLIASTYDKSQLERWCNWALVEKGADIKTNHGAHGLTAASFEKLVEGDSIKFYAALWRVILWPAGNASIFHPDLAPPGSVPERLPGLGTKDVHELAEACGVSMETVWAAAAKESMQRSLVLQWFERHTKEQLVDLASSLGVGLKDGRRSDMAAELLSHHQLSPLKKPLKLPAALATNLTQKAKRGKR